MTLTAPRTLARLDSLTGVRAIAVALVFWHHGTEPFDALSVGMVGVSLFYLLSGFVMAWTDRESDTPWLFYRRRFARIVPAYLVAVAIALALKAARGDFAVTDLAALTLMQSWVPDPAVYFAADAVFWSLSCEVFFYLVFPWLRLITRRLGTRGLIGLGTGAAAVSVAVTTTAWAAGGELTQWVVTVLPPSRLPEFVIGVVAGTLVARGWQPRISLWLAFPLAAGAVAAAMFVPYEFSRYLVTLAPFTLLVIALAGADIRGTAGFTRWPVLVKLGIWSYCFYLLHNLVLILCLIVADRLGVPTIVAVVGAAVAAVVAAWLLHIGVERPAERWLRPAGRPRMDTDEPAAVKV